MSKVIVVGASYGGVQALIELTAALPGDLDAALLVVLHVGQQRSILPALLASKAKMAAAHARDGETLAFGRIYVAPPDHHMLVMDMTIRLSRGAREHHTRPAVDPLFRSAALAHGPDVVGVVLTGHLDDGTVGLQEIKKHGGIAVVQDPEEAAAPSMPRSALRYVEVDHCVPLPLMPMLLASLVAAPSRAAVPVRDDRAVHEQALTLSEGEPMQHLEAIAAPSTFACPDCHGALWEVLDSRPQRYRCHTGHAFTARTLQDCLANAQEEALWSGMRALQERQLLLQDMAAHDRQAGNEASAARLAAAAERLERQTEVLRSLVEKSPDPVE